MHSPAEIPRTGVSAEAEAWLLANPPVQRLAIDHTNADRVRAAIRFGWAKAMAAARAEFDVEERLVEVGGVECLEITAGSDIDVLEIDAATYSKVEQGFTTNIDPASPKDPPDASLVDEQLQVVARRPQPRPVPREPFRHKPRRV